MSELSSNNNNNVETVISGGFFEFDDGGCYAGDWVNGQAYGYGKCTGPQGKGEYAGTWKSGFEVSGVYTWPNGNTYEGEWVEGKRGGVGVESKGNWIYKGEWTQGLKGKYGVRLNLISEAKYEGSWISGMQEGLGVETYVDESTYQGQWSKGLRHGFGVRKSVPRGIAAIYKSSGSATSLRPSASLPSGLSNKHTSSVSSQDNMYGSTLDNRKQDDSDRDRGGFVLVEKSKPSAASHHGLQRSRSFSLSRTLSKRFRVKHSDSMNGSGKQQLNNAAFSSDPSNLCGSADTGRSSLLACSVDVNLASVIETYSGEWKNDKRCGFGISQRSDGLRYEGEWFNDRRCGYGVTVFKDGSREEGKYRNNELISSLSQKRKIFSKKKAKDRVDASVGFARKASDAANQKSEMALAKRRTAISKAVLADEAAKKARYFADIARKHAQKFELVSIKDGATTEGEEQDKRIEDTNSKQIGRGESGDSQMSSWSGSSLPSTKKNSSHHFYHEDDNVFLNFQEKETETRPNANFQLTKSDRFDFDLSKFQVEQHANNPSTDDSSKYPNAKPTTTSSDMRDYFDDSAPEFMTRDEEVANNRLSHLQPDDRSMGDKQFVTDGNDFRRANTNFSLNSAPIATQIDPKTDSRSHDQANRRTREPQSSSVLNKNNSNNQTLTAKTQDLRRRFSVEQKSRERLKSIEGPPIEDHNINRGGQNSNLIYYERKDGPDQTFREKKVPSGTSAHLSQSNQTFEHKPETFNPLIDFERWWNQNSLLVLFLAINLIFSVLFFGLWPSRG